MNPELGRQIARQIEANQVALLRNESARRQKLASTRAQVLTYRDGAVYNQGSNGSLTPTRLITNRGIPEGGSVARKGGGASDASPYFRRIGLASISQNNGKRRSFAIGLEVEFIRANYIGVSGPIASADQVDLIPNGQIEILNAPGDLSNPFKFLIPSNSAQAEYSRGDRAFYTAPVLSETAGTLSNVTATPWRGPRLVTLVELAFGSQVLQTNFELRMASKANPDFPDSNGGFEIPGEANVVTFMDSQVVGIPDATFRLPDYRLIQSIPEGFLTSVIAIRIKRSDVSEVGL